MTTAESVYELVYAEIDANFRALYGPGRVFQWRSGKYKGRQCVVKQMYWEYETSVYNVPVGVRVPKFRVYVLVETYRKNPLQGFMDGMSSFARTYHEWTPEKFAVVFTPENT